MSVLVGQELEEWKLVVVARHLRQGAERSFTEIVRRGVVSDGVTDRKYEVGVEDWMMGAWRTVAVEGSVM